MNDDRSRGGRFDGSNQYPESCAGGLLLHAGTDVAWMAEGILAAPWWNVL